MGSLDRINLARLSYVIYEHPELERFVRFANDFGFEHNGESDDGSVYLKGYGMDPYLYIARPSTAEKRFIGAGFTACTEDDFSRACAMPRAQLVDVGSRPGGGRMVSIPDSNGYTLEILFGQSENTVPDNGISNVFEGKPNVNRAVDKARKGIFNRMNTGPAKVHKLGHFGYITDKYTDTCAWYTNHFNFKATDIVHPPGKPQTELMSFFHLDLGQEYVDHHCLLIAQRHERTGTGVHHASFEVEDLDTQMMGHEWLRAQGYQSMWGVGRHIMGSQIFDYWYDTTGFIVEHYADGDVVNENTPTVRSAGTAAAIWGPPMPSKWG